MGVGCTRASGGGRNEGVLGHVHAPGQRGVDAVVAVAGGEAADAADAVADGGGGGGEVEHAQPAEARAGDVFSGPLKRATRPCHIEGDDAGDQAAEPGEAGAKPARGSSRTISMGWCQPGSRIWCQAAASMRGSLQLVPELGAKDAGEDDHGDDVEGVGVDAVALEVPIAGRWWRRRPQTRAAVRRCRCGRSQDGYKGTFSLPV